MADYNVSFGKKDKPVYDFIDIINFESDGVNGYQYVSIQVGAFRELAYQIGINNRITLIKIVRGLSCQNGSVLGLKFAKDIVEWFADNMDFPTK